VETASAITEKAVQAALATAEAAAAGTLVAVLEATVAEEGADLEHQAHPQKNPVSKNGNAQTGGLAQDRVFNQGLA
jgi:hypothetical protein